MPQQTVDALVLRRWDVGESDRRIVLLTRELGKTLATARGARRAKSSLAGVSEPMMAGSFEIALGRANNYVIQAQSKFSFSGIRTDFSRLNCALAWLELLDTMLHTGENVSGSFELGLIGLASIETSKSPNGSVAWAALKLLHLLGYAPIFDRSAVSGKKLSEPVCISACSGGAILGVEAETAHDALDIDRDIATTLAKLQELDEPPTFVKRSQETWSAVGHFIEHLVGAELPAMRAALRSG